LGQARRHYPFIPTPVIAGFTAGTLIIFGGQWKYFFGLHPAASGHHFHEKILAWCTAVLTKCCAKPTRVSPKNWKFWAE